MEYVISFAKKVGFQNSNVLLIEKNKPDWQKGRYNLPGGKIEPGETPLQAAVRELEEEAGIKPCLNARLAGAIIGSWGTVYCVIIPIFDDAINQPENELEKVFWTSWDKIQDSPLLIPNLRVVIPLLLTGTTDWVIRDEGPSWEQQLHTIKVTINADGKRCKWGE